LKQKIDPFTSSEDSIQKMSNASRSAENKKSILVTGANGFIGSSIINTFASKDCFNVRGSVRTDLAASRKHQFAKYFYELDVDSDIGWDQAMNGADCIIHCAAKYHINNVGSGDLSEICRKINVEGTIRLAELAVKSGVRRFIFLSSLKVHGEVSDPRRPFVETDAPNPMYPYGISKLEAEQELLRFGLQNNLEVVIVRPPPVYGPGVGANFYAMLKSVDAGYPLPLGGIHNKRSYVSINNLTSFLEACIRVPEASGELFLVSDKEDVSTSELLQRVGRSLGRKARLFWVPKQLLEFGATLISKPYLAELLLMNFQANIGKAEKILGWTPIETVDEGLELVATSYFADNA